MNNFFRRSFLSSASGVAGFLGVELLILLTAWWGKIGPDLLIGLALFVQLGLSYAVFLNLLPIFGFGVAGYIAGIAPQTAQTAGGSASSFVSQYVRATMGISHAITLLILSLFILDYDFNLGLFLFVGILLLAWGQYALVFPGQSRIPQRISTTILLIITIGAVVVSLSPGTAKFLTGRPFWSGADYKASAVSEKQMDRHAEEKRLKAIARVNRAIKKYKISSDEELDSYVSSGKVSSEDVQIFRHIRDGGKWDTIPEIFTNGAGVAPPFIEQVGGKVGSFLQSRKSVEIRHTVGFNQMETFALPEGKWKVNVIPHGRPIYRWSCGSSGGGAADILRSAPGSLRVNGVKSGESFRSLGSVVITNDNPNNKPGCTVTVPTTVIVQLTPESFISLPWN